MMMKPDKATRVMVALALVFDSPWRTSLSFCSSLLMCVCFIEVLIYDGVTISNSLFYG